MSNQSYTWKNPPSASRALIATLFAIVVLVYATIAIGTSDYLWFLKRVPADPLEIVIHFDGQTVSLEQSDANFMDISNALKLTITQLYGYPQSVGLSSQTLQNYREHDWSIEAFYDEPLRLHSQFRFGEPRQLILPLSGRHAEQNIMFLGLEEQFYTGPSLKNTQELKRTLRDYGFAPQE